MSPRPGRTAPQPRGVYAAKATPRVRAPVRRAHKWRTTFSRNTALRYANKVCRHIHARGAHCLWLCALDARHAVSLVGALAARVLVVGVAAAALAAVLRRDAARCGLGRSGERCTGRGVLVRDVGAAQCSQTCV
jgi:hypothetical protein